MRRPRTSSAQSYHSDHRGDDDGGGGGGGGGAGAISTGRTNSPSALSGLTDSKRARAQTIDSADYTRARSASTAAAKVRRRKKRQSEGAVADGGAGDVKLADDKPPVAPGSVSSHYVKRSSLKSKKSLLQTAPASTMSALTSPAPVSPVSDSATRASTITSPAPAESATQAEQPAVAAPTSTSFASEIRQRAHLQRAKIFERSASQADVTTTLPADQGAKRRSLTRHMTLATEATRPDYDDDDGDDDGDDSATPH